MSESGEKEFLAGLGDQQPELEAEVKKPEVIEEVESNEDQGGEPEVELSPMEQKAHDQGWRPQDDFEGPKDHWKTAKEYIKDGEWLAKIKDLKQDLDRVKIDADERVSNNNKLNEARRKSEISKLKTQQREAAEDADVDAYDKAQREIEVLENEFVEAPVVPQKDPSITEWEANNAWINDVNDERSTVAQGIFNNYANQNKNATPAQALEHLDKRIKELYPTKNENPRREQPNTNETPRKSAQRKNRDLTMSDLTPTEQGEWNMYGQTMFKTEKAFLKAVKDARVK